MKKKIFDVGVFIFGKISKKNVVWILNQFVWSPKLSNCKNLKVKKNSEEKKTKTEKSMDFDFDYQNYHTTMKKKKFKKITQIGWIQIYPNSN